MTRAEALAASPVGRARRQEGDYFYTLDAQGALWKSRGPGTTMVKQGPVADDEAATDWLPVREQREL